MTGPLVLGVGNPARGDDGVGPAVAEAVKLDPRLAGATVRSVLQLTPELAADVAEASIVVVVDARAGLPPGRIEWAAVEPRPGPPVFSHHVPPAALVALAEAVYGQAPPVFLVGVGAAGFDAGAPLSGAVAAAVAGAVEVVTELVRARSRPGTSRGASPDR